MEDDERTRRGMQVRREVLGEAHVDRTIATTTTFTAPFQDLITRYVWGEIWTRPGLSRTERSMVTLAVLTALGREHELGMHVRAALRNGLTAEQISEVLLHSGVYAGVPAANRAFAIAKQVLREEGAGELIRTRSAARRAPVRPPGARPVRQSGLRAARRWGLVTMTSAAAATAKALAAVVTRPQPGDVPEST